MDNTTEFKIKQEKQDYSSDQDIKEQEHSKEFIKSEIEEEYVYEFEEKPNVNTCNEILDTTVKCENIKETFGTNEIGSIKLDIVDSESRLVPKLQSRNKPISTKHVQNKTKQTKKATIHNERRKSRDFNCTECGFHTTSVGTFRKHMKIRHNKFETYQCQHSSYSTHDDTVYCHEQCDFKTMHKPELKRHYQWKHDDKSLTYICGHCCYVTKRKHCLNRHIKMKHCDQTPTLKCHYCQYSTKWSQSLQRHVKVVHIDKQKSKSLSSNLQSGDENVTYETTQSDPQIDDSIQCKNEPNIEVLEHDLKPQLHNSSGNNSSSVEQILSGLKKIKSKADRNDLGCSTSPVNKVLVGNGTHTFPVILDTTNTPQTVILLKPTNVVQTVNKNNNNINNKLTSCDNTKKQPAISKENDVSGQNNTTVITQCGSYVTFRCAFCEYTTGSKAYLSRHQKKEHADVIQATVTCEYCSYKCNGRAELNRHFKLKHDTNTEVFECAFCPFKTKYRPEFNRHYKLKHDESSLSFACGFCRYVTKRKHSLIRHIKMKHDECTETLRCKVCNYTTKWKQSLKTHVKLKHCKDDKPVVIKDEILD